MGKGYACLVRNSIAISLAAIAVWLCTIEISHAADLDYATGLKFVEFRELKSEEPYAEWIALVRAAAMQDVSEVPECEWTAAAAKDARIAKAAAFIYALDNEIEMRQKWEQAMTALAGVPGHKVEGNELLPLCNIAQDTAFSLLFIRRRIPKDGEIYAAAQDTAYLIGMLLTANKPDWYAVAKNNWGVRQFSALKSCAIIMRGMPGSPQRVQTVDDWFSYCETELPKHIGAQLVPGSTIRNLAGWAEGHGYLAYSLDTLIDLWWLELNALDRREGVISLVAADISEWSILSSAPDGFRPNFDDSPLAYFPSNKIASIVKRESRMQAAELMWDHARQIEHAGYTESDPIMALLTYDPEIVPSKPSDGVGLHWFDTGTGDMAMRTGWDVDDGYVMMRIEKDRAHWGGLGHEQLDQLSVIFYGHLPNNGEWVLIDGGYINWENRERVAPPGSHNMLLVDGGGPDWTAPVPGGEVTGAFLKPAAIYMPGYSGGEPKGFYGGATTRYRGVEWTREVLFIKYDMLFIRDTVKPLAKGEGKRLSFPWHLNMPAEKPLEDGYAGSKLGGRFHEVYFELPGEKVSSIEFYSETPLEISFRTAEHSFKYGEVLEHNVAEVSCPADAFANSGAFTLYTLVCVWDGSGYLSGWDPPESIPQIIEEIWRQTDG